MSTLRSPETEKQYREQRLQDAAKGVCVLCAREPLKSFEFWKIVSNKFPYDLIAQKHEMLVPVRHITGRDLTEEEKNELQKLKDEYLGEHYGFILEGTRQTMSIPSHFHLHLITLKERL